MNKIDVSILGQPVSFDAASCFTQNFHLRGEDVVVSTAPDDPRLMISIGGRRPKPIKPNPNRASRPIVVTDEDATTPATCDAEIQISVGEGPLRIEHDPNESLVYISIGGARPKGGARPAQPLSVCFDTSAGQWEFHQLRTSHQIVARLAASTTQP